ncbi:MAG: heavy-metal-associated domain-containing protein [Desulfuromonadales bacterium]|nr:MAG: heavy-metal-associated domain-containing protein [Desulfuromonadales bacterium]
MNRKTILNGALVVAAIVVVGIFAFSVRLEASADTVAVLRTHGMTCGSCSSRIEQALKGHAGVASVQVSVDAGQVVVGYDSKLVGAEALAEKVTATGFGSSILQVLSPDQYKAMTGKSIAAAPSKGGCGGGCCGKGQPVPK